MLLIQVAVSVNVACRPWQPQSDGTELTSCNLLWWKYLWKWLLSPQQSQTEDTELSPCYLSWWKYMWMWLVGLRQPQTEGTELLPLDATYLNGSICKSGLSVHYSHRAITMKLILACRSTIVTATSPCNLLCGSTYESGLSVQDRQAFFTNTFTRISSRG